MKVCPKCGNPTLMHLYDTAHGIPETHMVGTERFECNCGFYCSNAVEAKKLGLNFILDTVED